MNYSVIIPTYNGAHKIGGVLDALNRQNLTGFEVIVVVDGSTDGTVEMLKAYDANYPLKIHEQGNKGRAATRNSGAGQASGDLLVFYDDDVRPGTNSLERHLNFHEKNPNAICSGNQFEDIAKCKTDIQKYKSYLSWKWASKYEEGINQVPSDKVFLTAANMSIKKADFTRLNGFDERLSDAEDFDLALRAIDQGYGVYFDKTNIALHDDYITCAQYIERQRQYALANEMLKKLKPQFFLNANNREIKLTPIKKFGFSFFSQKYWVRWIDDGRLTWLPRNVRYKIYDWAITGLGKIYTNRSIRGEN